MRRTSPPSRFPVLVCLTVLATTPLGCGWIDKAAAEDTKVVVFSGGAATSIVIDGGEAVELGEGKFRSFAVGPGAHELVFDGERKVSVTLEAFDRWVVPAVDEQCFFSIDVSRSHYSADGENRLGGPDISKRQQQSEPFNFPREHYLTEKELPSQVSSGQLLYMLRSLPCAELDRLEAGLDDKAGGQAGGQGEAKPPANPSTARLLEFSEAIGCDAPEGAAKAWCITAGAWTHADDAKLTLPEKGMSYVGLSVELKAGADLTAVLDSAKLSLLSLRPEEDGTGAASISGVLPENEEERKELDATFASVIAVFTGEAKELVVDKDLGAYLDSLPASADIPLKASERGWSDGESLELRAAGPLVVALEDGGEGNLFLSFHLPR